MSNMTLSVTQISNYIKSIFDAEELLIGVSVYGEITNLKPSARAIYFDIKDENSALPCVCFDQYLLRGFEFGDQVAITGKLNYYAKTGKLSFIVSKIEKYGVGELYKQFIELKDKLQKEGLFDEARKKLLPKYVKKVGVVSSETGAVIRDIIRVKSEKNSCSDIVLFPVKVQGVGADVDIVRGIKYLDNYGVDCIIVARGGGSFEDYQPFNTEVVARAVSEAKTPIVSAIGHENDWSIIDYVADVRAGTPSIASELVFFSDKELISDMITDIKRALGNIQLDLTNKYSKLISLEKSFTSCITRKTDSIEGLVNLNNVKINNAIDVILNKKQTKLDLVSLKISKCNPIEIMNRGYSATYKDNLAVKSITDIAVGDELYTKLIDGVIASTVKSVKEKRI